MRHRVTTLSARGFTLLEILLAVILTAVILIAAYQTLIGYLNSYGATKAQNEVSHNLRSIHNRLGKTISKALAVNTPATAGGSASVLNLKMTASGTGACGTDGVTCFDLTTAPANEFRIQENISPAEIVTTATVKVDSFTVTKLVNGSQESVLVAITVRYSGPESTFRKTMEFVYALR